MQPPTGRQRTRTKAHDGAQRPRHNAHMNKHITVLLLAAALMLASCVRQQPVWLDAPPAGVEAEARMMPVASGITQGELSDMLRGSTLPDLWVGFGGGYLWTEEKTGGNRKGGEIHLVGGFWDKGEGLGLLGRLDAIFLDSQGGVGNFAGIGLGLGAFIPYFISPYVLIEGMLGYDDVDSELVVALLPEVGVNFFTPVVQGTLFILSVSARHFKSTQGRDDDFWLFGVSLTLGEGF